MLKREQKTIRFSIFVFEIKKRKLKKKRFVFPFSFLNLKNKNEKKNRFSFILLNSLHVKCNCGIEHGCTCVIILCFQKRTKCGYQSLNTRVKERDNIN